MLYFICDCDTLFLVLKYFRVLPGLLAQLAEQQTLNLWVLGSIPRQPTKKICKSGGIGRRAGLRIQFPNKEWGFESLLLHQSPKKGEFW